MKKYTGSDYRALNTYLRTGEILNGYSENQLKQTIAFMDKAIKRASLPEEITVYRLSTEQEFKRDDKFLKHMFNLDLDPLGPLDSLETLHSKKQSILLREILLREISIKHIEVHL